MLKNNYKTIELLFDLPRRLKNIDNRLKNLSLYNLEEDNTEKLFNKLIDIKLLRNRLYNKYIVLVNTFNTLNKNIRNSVVAVFMKNMPIKKVSSIVNIKERTMYRKFEKVNEILETALNNQAVVEV